MSDWQHHAPDLNRYLNMQIIFIFKSRTIRDTVSQALATDRRLAASAGQRSARVGGPRGLLATTAALPKKLVDVAGELEAEALG